MHTFQLKLKDLKGKIKKWNKEEFGNIQKEHELIQTKMKKVQRQIINKGRSEGLAEEEGQLINKMEERRQQE